jgi:hypothetical protein
MMFQILANLIGPDKLGGWVRSGVAALLAMVIAKFPGIEGVLDPATQAAIGVVVSGIVVGIWSQLTKSDAGKVAMVDALAKDPTSPVRGTILDNNTAGREMAASLPGQTTAVAGTVSAKAIAQTNGVK